MLRRISHMAVLMVALAGLSHQALARGPEFRTNTHMGHDQDDASVASLAGGFVVIWQSDCQVWPTL
jgi:hypothetical protein